MKLRSLFLTVLPIIIGCLANTGGPAKARGTNTERNTVEFGLRYDFSVPARTSRIQFTVIVPQTIPNRQKVSITYSPEPSKIFDKNGVRYAEFIFEEPERQFSVEIRIRADVFRYDLSTIRKKQRRKLLQGPRIEDFLKHEKYIEKNDPNIQEIAKKITGENDLELVRNIYNYIIDNMEYGNYTSEPLGAVKAIQQKKGDCTEYSYLFVALCRAKNIPAKFISGFTTKFIITPRHNWAEVYLTEYGWVPFDASLGDVRKLSERSKRFHTLEPIYVYRTHFDKDEVLENYNFYFTRYWGVKPRVKGSIEFK